MRLADEIKQAWLGNEWRAAVVGDEGTDGVPKVGEEGGMGADSSGSAGDEADEGAEESEGGQVVDVVDVVDGSGSASVPVATMTAMARLREGQRLVVVVATGVGATALFLARHLAPYGIEVVAVPCIGTKHYLKRQMVSHGRGRGRGMRARDKG